MTIIDILVFILILSVLVVVHELGHFFVARRSGIWVEEFGFGIPPRIFGKKIGETIYSINLFPFGGFVRLHGENSEDGVNYPNRAFLNKSKKIKAAVVAAGVVMNFLLAIFIFAATYTVNGIPRETKNVSITSVSPGSPAETGKINIGDIVRKVDDQNITETGQFITEIDEKRGREISLVIERGGELLTVNITPRENPPQGEGAMGVGISSVETYFPPLWQRPFIGVYYGINDAILWAGLVLKGFGQMFSQLFQGIVPKEVSGPVGIVALTSQAAKYGFWPVMNLMAILSINLAILNVLPFPALDGGRLFFIILESIFRKKVPQKFEAWAHTVGIVILIALLLAVTVKDITGLISAGSVKGFIENMIQ